MSFQVHVHCMPKTFVNKNCKYPLKIYDGIPKSFSHNYIAVLKEDLDILIFNINKNTNFTLSTSVYNFKYISLIANEVAHKCIIFALDVNNMLWQINPAKSSVSFDIIEISMLKDVTDVIYMTNKPYLVLSNGNVYYYYNSKIQYKPMYKFN